jgi:F0F1-type ATP synthase assembly protein I
MYRTLRKILEITLLVNTLLFVLSFFPSWFLEVGFIHEFTYIFIPISIFSLIYFVLKGKLAKKQKYQTEYSFLTAGRILIVAAAFMSAFSTFFIFMISFQGEPDSVNGVYGLYNKYGNLIKELPLQEYANVYSERTRLFLIINSCYMLLIYQGYDYFDPKET